MLAWFVYHRSNTWCPTLGRIERCRSASVREHPRLGEMPSRRPRLLGRLRLKSRERYWVNGYATTCATHRLDVLMPLLGFSFRRTATFIGALTRARSAINEETFDSAPSQRAPACTNDASGPIGASRPNGAVLPALSVAATGIARRSRRNRCARRHELALASCCQILSCRAGAIQPAAAARTPHRRITLLDTGGSIFHSPVNVCVHPAAADVCRCCRRVQHDC